MQSPRLKLFASDLLPIAKKTAEQCVTAVVTIVLAALTSDEVQKVVTEHWGATASLLLVSIVGVVAGGRLLKDNRKGNQ
jgi:hypothetical protein